MRRREAWLSPSIARRPWRASERRIVTRGFWGRAVIAIEPFVIAAFFAILAVGLLVRHQEGAIFVAPIFAGASVLFFVYATVLMVPVTRAVMETFEPIWIVDGYVSYREHLAPFQDPVYYVAVLDERRGLLGEWTLDRRPEALGREEPWPAHVEFTRIGGILRIDGRSTGVLPDEMPAFGVGAARRYTERAAERE